VKVDVPATDGVPERVPVELSEIPGGGVCAVMDHATDVGPDDCSVCVYNEPT
jgi:hypothetical protein